MKTLDAMPEEVAQVLHDVLKWYGDKTAGRANVAEQDLVMLEESAGEFLEWARIGRPEPALQLELARRLAIMQEHKTGRPVPRPKLRLVCSRCGSTDVDCICKK